MAVTIRDTLRLSCFEDVKLLAGESGLDNVIRQVTIIDTPYSRLDYTVATVGDFAISSFYYAKDSVEDMYRYINLRLKTRCCGICITSEYIQELPEEICRYCDENKFPILMVDEETPYAGIILQITELVLLDTQKSMLQTKLMTVAGNKVGSHQALQLMRELNPHFSQYITAIYIMPDLNLPDKAYEPHRFSEPLEALFNQGILSFGIEYQNGVLGLVSYDGKSAEKIEEAISYYVGSVLELNTGVLIGVSDYEIPLSDSGTAIQQAIMAANTRVSYTRTTQVTYYAKLGVITLLMQLIGNPEMDKFIDRILQPIHDYDKANNAHLFATMSCFIENNRDYQKAADELCVHNNTVRYRVRKVEEILDMNAPSQDFCETFSIALKCSNIK